VRRSPRGLAAEGAAAVVNYASSREHAERVVAEIKGNGGKAISVKADVSKAAEVEELFAETENAFGGLDVLVNNAGVYRFAPIEELTEEELHRQFNINVLGTLLASREALKYFGSDGGSVINISSIASQNPMPAAVVSSSTKGALDTATRGLAKDWAQGTSGSMPSNRAGSRPKARARSASLAAISTSRWWRAPRSGASANRTTSPRSRCSWPRPPPAG
jgi:NAD(P)-dependent dehydrogenase (short-subunit alcohol dehydrogenase family)